MTMITIPKYELGALLITLIMCIIRVGSENYKTSSTQFGKIFETIFSTAMVMVFAFVFVMQVIM